MIKYEIFDIDWDTDGYSAKKLGLPATVLIEIDDNDDCYDFYDEEEYINNYLSNNYGFCVYNWCKREVL